MSGLGDKVEGKWDEAKGSVKERVGEESGDEDLRDEGRVDQAKGKFEGAKGEVKDKAEDVKDKVQDAFE